MTRLRRDKYMVRLSSIIGTPAITVTLTPAAQSTVSGVDTAALQAALFGRTFRSSLAARH